MGMEFSVEENFARQMDAEDPLREFRERFHLPADPNGAPLIYFVGNSLGLMPKTARGLIEQELNDWQNLAVDAHLGAKTPWYTYHESVREPLARVVGAQPHEVVAMNSLTVNLHLLLATFYCPTKNRCKILMEEPAFPSDTYAIKSQIAHHGIDPQNALVLARPRDGELTVRAETIHELLESEGDQIALVVLAGVNFFTGQLFDIKTITAEAQKQGIIVGIDLAHAVGNVPLALHDWNVDFGIWCSYKYLNSGPGAVAGAYLHERHARNTDLPRFAGWFGNDPKTRFQMRPEFVPVAAADAWQVSNPPIFSMTPLRASLAIFDEAGGMRRLREKSVKLTGYLDYLLHKTEASGLKLVTPQNAAERGSQLSLLASRNAKEIFAGLEAGGVKCDFREPNVIRAAPTPLYNTFHEVWRFVKLLGKLG